MTNEHVVTKSMIENENTIKVYYDNEKKKIEIKLNPNERIIEIFTYLDIDLSVVEILFKDGTNKDSLWQFDLNKESVRTIMMN